tara:strand:- start:769 stop:1713 length:945 start_codon:yes stop_codon:yes gene_type:complete
MQNVIGNFIEPVIYASALNVRNVACLMSLLFWGFVWGIPGMILAMPILIFVKILVEELADYDSGTSEGEWSLINCLAFIISPPEFSFGVKLESISFLNATARNASPHELQRLLDDPTLPEYNRIVLTYSAGMSGEERRATLTVTPFSSDEKRAFYRSTGELIGLEGYCVVKKIGKAPLAVTQEGRLPSGLDLWDLANSVWLSWESKEGVEAPTAAITVDDHVANTFQSYLRNRYLLRIPRCDPHTALVDRRCTIGLVRPIDSDGSDRFDLLKNEQVLSFDGSVKRQEDFVRDLPGLISRCGNPSSAKHFQRCYK